MQNVYARPLDIVAIIPSSCTVRNTLHKCHSLTHKKVVLQISYSMIKNVKYQTDNCDSYTKTTLTWVRNHCMAEWNVYS